MTISALPASPARTDSGTLFRTKADALLAALPQFVIDANTLAGQINTNAVSTSNSASAAAALLATANTNIASGIETGVYAATANILTTLNTAAATSVTNANLAVASASAALLVSGTSVWISGTSYVQYANVISPLDYQTYRRWSAGSGTIDPSNDSAHWICLSNNLPSAATYTYDAAGKIIGLSETVSGSTRTTTISYNTDGTVYRVITVYNGATRTETYTYTAGVITGLTVS